jgi:hypothetical protein
MTSTDNPVLDEAKLEAFVGQAVVESTVICTPGSMAQEAGFRRVCRATGTPLNIILEARP